MKIKVFVSGAYAPTLHKKEVETIDAMALAYEFGNGEDGETVIIYDADKHDELEHIDSTTQAYADKEEEAIIHAIVWKRGYRKYKKLKTRRKSG